MYAYLEQFRLGVPVAQLDLIHRGLILEWVRGEVPDAGDVEARMKSVLVVNWKVKGRHTC